MPKTYYDSELTGAQIESALEAIHGVVTPSNNGKVLYIDNGQIKAASASRWGHGAVLEPLSVTANGDYTPPTGTDGFDEVHVAVPSATLTTKSITQNGTYNASQDNADGYSSVTVNVSGGGSAVVQPLSVTQNGTYNPPSGVDGYAPVTVNVSGGGSGIVFPGSETVARYYIGRLTTVTFSESGYYAVLGAIDGSSSASISFSVSGATVIESDNKTSVNSSWGSAATGILLFANAGNSITITGTTIARQVMIVISIPNASTLSSLDLTVEKDRPISKTIQNTVKQYCFFMAGTTGDNGVSVNVTSDNERKWYGEATNPAKLHKYGAFEGNSAISCNVQGTSYATNYALFFEAE